MVFLCYPPYGRATPSTCSIYYLAVRPPPRSPHSCAMGRQRAPAPHSWSQRTPPHCHRVAASPTRSPTRQPPPLTPPPSRQRPLPQSPPPQRAGLHTQLPATPRPAQGSERPVSDPQRHQHAPRHTQLLHTQLLAAQRPTTGRQRPTTATPGPPYHHFRGHAATTSTGCCHTFRAFRAHASHTRLA